MLDYLRVPQDNYSSDFTPSFENHIPLLNRRSFIALCSFLPLIFKKPGLLYGEQLTLDKQKKFKGFLNNIEIPMEAEDSEIDRLNKVVRYMEEHSLFNIEKPESFDPNKPTVALISVIHASGDLALRADNKVLKILMSELWIKSRHRLLHLFKLLGIDAKLSPFFLENAKPSQEKDFSVSPTPLSHEQALEFRERNSDETQFVLLVRQQLQKFIQTHRPPQDIAYISSHKAYIREFFSGVFDFKATMMDDELTSWRKEQVFFEPYISHINRLFSTGIFNFHDDAQFVLIDHDRFEQYIQTEVKTSTGIFLLNLQGAVEYHRQHTLARPDNDVRARLACRHLKSYFNNNPQDKLALLEFGLMHRESFKHLLSSSLNLFIVSDNNPDFNKFFHIEEALKHSELDDKKFKALQDALKAYFATKSDVKPTK